MAKLGRPHKKKQELPSRYAGIRAPNGVAVYRDGQLLGSGKSSAVKSYACGGFDWGYDGAGAKQLALALLLDFTGNPAFALKRHEEFARKVVVRFDREFWILEGQQLVEWLATPP